jgi:O-antigen/teichoic acid export membrane protein
MFAGNVASAALAFVIVIITARVLGPIQFGLFFALYNFIQLVSSVADIGVGSGIVNFIPHALSRGEAKPANQYLKAGWDIVLFVSFVLSLIGIFAPRTIIVRLFPGISVTQWLVTVLASTSFILINFVIFAFQARKEFVRSIAANLGYSATRTVIIVIIALLGRLNVLLAVGAYAASSILGVVFSLPFLPRVIGNLNKPTRSQSRELLRFSAHLGLGKIAANIASRIDVQMLYPLAGAFATAQYGIAQRVAFLYMLFSSSAGAVIAPKIASISDRNEVKSYAQKIILLTAVLLLGLIFGIVVADPLIPLLFGDKYPGIVPVVRWMLIATIPFLLNLTPVNLVIYFQKDSKLIGFLSVIQLGIVIALNIALIPRIGVFGPVVAYAAGNTLVGLVTWYKVRNLFL